MAGDRVGRVLTRKEPRRRPTHAPPVAQRRQQGGGQHHVPIVVALPLFDADHRPATVDIGRAKALTAPTEAAHAAVNEAARLCLAVGEEAWLLWEANTALDKPTTDSDIARPETTGPHAPMFPLAGSASELLRVYFQGGQPGRVDPEMLPDIGAALAEREQ